VKKTRADVPPDFVEATNGDVYVSLTRLSPKTASLLKGRERFVGVLLTPTEQRRFRDELHGLAFNAVYEIWPAKPKRAARAVKRRR